MTSQMDLAAGLREHRERLRRELHALDEAIRIIEGAALPPTPDYSNRHPSSIPGRKPAGVDIITEVARTTGTSIRQIAREVGIGESTLKSQVTRNAVTPSVAIRVQEWARKKLKTE